MPEPRTCDHVVTTEHFVWHCTGRAGHGGRGHHLRSTPFEDAQ